MTGKCSLEKFHERDEERQPRGKVCVRAGTRVCQSSVTVSVFNYCRLTLI